ncbi:Membrane associated serine protease, rhomboid family [Filimonas lacunae]|uniref:Membrane associated serine protease, rhomboid family n=1 Tax=Filimonas lacunae TaxID=477680 RepID=A0A173MJY7_9BACT|nr:rhomboid family intramembrane serine protease [Filimonas lacunae]BAV07955.1 rhomboid family protein [Filimonas lacunae]SIT07110.1 Membrane associated serine protease, rhomboid family [Filimonas lacunae]
MVDIGIIGIILIVLNFLISNKGFSSRAFFDKYKFQVSSILVGREYVRFISSGFLHVGWQHLIFNMITLLLFSSSMENVIGSIPFLAIYFAGLAGGGLLALFIHRNHNDYSAVGASGAVCGVVFASIALFPGSDIGFFGIPFGIPTWLYGTAYILYSIYGIRSAKDNIGHEAHLGGALVGMITAIIMYPVVLQTNAFTIALITIPAILFIIFITVRPHSLLVDNSFFKSSHNITIDHKYNIERNIQRQEIDRILDKINERGMNSLTRQEKERLEEYSKHS